GRPAVTQTRRVLAFLADVLQRRNRKRSLLFDDAARLHAAHVARLAPLLGVALDDVQPLDGGGTLLRLHRLYGAALALLPSAANHHRIALEDSRFDGHGVHSTSGASDAIFKKP